MRELALNAGLRVLLGVIGGVGMCAGLAVGAEQLRSAMRDASNRPAGIALVFACAVIAFGGWRVLQGAWRGRIAVRDPAGRRISSKRR